MGGLAEDIEIKKPSDYKVILLNDDYTTKDFVVMILERVFHKSTAESIKIMESVHKTGKGVAGVYPFDIAATRCQIVLNMARNEGFPLRCEMEEA